MAQSSDTFYIKAKLSPDNEVPQITGLEGVNGSARIKVTINQDAAGTIKSGSVEFALGYQFSRSVTLTGLHIHLGGVGENGPVVIDSQLSETAVPDGNGNLVIATPLLSTPEQVSTLTALMNSPDLYYIDLHTSDCPSGAIRGQVTAKTYFLRAALSPKSVVPAVTSLQASAALLMTLDVTRDASGTLTSGSVMLDAEYRFPSSVTISGLQIHYGKPGQTGDVVINVNLPNTTNSTGSGKLTKIISLPNDQATLNVLKAMISDPEPFYIEVYTTDYPLGALRGQLNGYGQLWRIPYSRDDGACRSNLGIQNLTNVPGNVVVGLVNRNGETIAMKSVCVPARGLAQLLRINSLFGNVEPESALYFGPDVHIEAFVSMIDNATNFPTIIPLASKGTRITIASVTNVGQFRSSLVITNTGSGPANVDIVCRDTMGGILGRMNVTINNNGFFSSEDILSLAGVKNAYGPLEIRSNNDQPIAAISRVYNVSDDRGGVLLGKEF